MMIGQNLGPYQVVDKLGEGGMGEVYRARDPRLGREVAIKVLPAAFSADPERLARFEHEARAAAALNHPNILAVHDLGQHENAPFIVSELLEGETLRDRLRAGPLPIRRTVEAAVQIAQGLAAAHDKGIVHRDLKPENVFITGDGRVKILDFGLAKLTERAPTLAGLSALPTTPPDTVPGVVLGTIGYMSPEQVRGLPADHRSDIFALGAVIYEMLSGRRAFHGATTADTMTAILKEVPPELPIAERRIPPALARIVDRCLEKNPPSRFQSAGDLAFALEGLSAHTETLSAIGAATPAHPRERVAWVTAAVLALALLVLAGSQVLRRPSETAAAIVHAVIPLTDRLQVEAELPSLAISADGRRIVYRPRGGGALHLREMDRPDPTPILGTEGVSMPFFSPDGQSVGFFAQGQLKKVSVAGGGVTTLAASAGFNRGAVWAADDTIVFSPSTVSGLYRVSGQGGRVDPLTTLDAAKGETSHRWPDVLPDGKAVLFTTKVGELQSFDDAQIVVRSIATGEQRVLFQGAFARYVPTGHIVYARAGALWAAPFDAGRLQTRGPSVKVLDGVITHPESGAAQFAIARSGALAYAPGDAHIADGSLAWVDRSGNASPISDRRASFAEPRLSPEGERLAVVIVAATNHGWISEISRGTFVRLTWGGNHRAPVWTPDGSRVTFWSDLNGGGIFSETADGSRVTEQLLQNAPYALPTSWAPDGRTLLYEQNGPSGRDIWLLRAGNDNRPTVFLQTPSNEFGAQCSPDGRWVAYVSDESGRPEVYVRPFPGPGGRIQISSQGGASPAWNRDGRELFFTTGDTLTSVPVSIDAGFRAGAPRALFSGYQFDAVFRNYDVSPDGSRFVVVQRRLDTAPMHLNLVLNWLEQLKSGAASTP